MCCANWIKILTQNFSKKKNFGQVIQKNSKIYFFCVLKMHEKRVGSGSMRDWSGDPDPNLTKMSRIPNTVIYVHKSNGSGSGRSVINGSLESGFVINIYVFQPDNNSLLFLRLRFSYKKKENATGHFTLKYFQYKKPLTKNFITNNGIHLHIITITI